MDFSLWVKRGLKLGVDGRYGAVSVRHYGKTPLRTSMAGGAGGGDIAES